LEACEEEDVVNVEHVIGLALTSSSSPARRWTPLSSLNVHPYRPLKMDSNTLQSDSNCTCSISPYSLDDRAVTSR
jgi:hypothetical protein